MRTAIVGLVVLGGVLGGCKEPKRMPRVDPATIVVSEIQTVRTDLIADAGRSASFVLVDADNKGPSEVLVTLGGRWKDASGAEVGTLRKESLRIPPGGRRTFALLDASLAPRPTAVAAAIEVVDAAIPFDRAPVRIVQGEVYQDQGRAVVAGYVVNDAPRGGKAIVIAGFHDGAGKPMTRPFTLYEIGAETKLPVRFVGPEGSRTGYIFVGDIVY
jgi:hypothetical protein